MHSSLWPTILQSDSAASRNVHWTVSTISHANFAFALLVFVTGFVTPLGLSDAIVTTSPPSANFEYARDLSLFGNSTPPRPSTGLSRDCNRLILFCPGGLISASRDFNNSYNLNTTDFNATTHLPANLTAMFTSATKDSTVAGAFDIQYRSWSLTSTPDYDGNRSYAKGAKRHIDTLLSNDKTVLVEGIVADMKYGGIGFRNHTIPSDVQRGVTWNEDILWLEPDISCANTNLSLRVKIGQNDISQLALVDQGGFAKLRHGNPGKGWTNPDRSKLDSGYQADRTAWMHNVLAAIYRNMTSPTNAKYGLNVTLNKEYTMSPLIGKKGDIAYPLGLSAYELQGSWLGNLPFARLNEQTGEIEVDGKAVPGGADKHPDIWAAMMLRRLDTYCSGHLSTDDVNYESFKSFECGEIFGLPRNINGDSTVVQGGGSEWIVPMHVCVGAIQASVQTLTFSMNGSAALENVEVLNRQPKHYTSEDDYPTWAFEYKDFSRLRTDSGYGEFNVPSPIWGIVDAKYTGIPGYNFTRAASFYLPHSFRGAWEYQAAPLDMLAATVAPVGILTTVVSNFGRAVTLDGPSFLPSYTGAQSMMLSTKWAQLAAKENGYGSILRLIWTDMLANSVMTAKPTIQTSFSSKNTVDGVGGRHSVHVSIRRVQYNLAYATPAIILLVFCIVFVLAALISGVVNWRLVKNLRAMLNDTSVGRVATSHATCEGGNLSRASTNQWQKRMGSTKLRFGGEESQVTMVQDDAQKPDR